MNEHGVDETYETMLADWVAPENRLWVRLLDEERFRRTKGEYHLANLLAEARNALIEEDK